MEVINLMKKDILVCKKYYAFSLIYIFSFSALFSEYGILLYGMIAIGVNYLINNTSMAFDDKYKADIMINILPVSRKNIVTAKYLNVLIVIFYVSVIYYLSVLVTAFKPIFGVKIPVVDLTTILISLLIICIFNSIEIPLYFILGYQKTRFFGLITFFGFFALSGFLANNIQINEKLNYFINNSSNIIKCALVLLITIFISYISYIISINIYRKKDF